VSRVTSRTTRRLASTRGTNAVRTKCQAENAGQRGRPTRRRRAASVREEKPRSAKTSTGTWRKKTPRRASTTAAAENESPRGRCLASKPRSARPLDSRFALSANERAAGSEAGRRGVAGRPRCARNSPGPQRRRPTLGEKKHAPPRAKCQGENAGQRGRPTRDLH
jgi:hypothetical protein